jgi:hypothetical protein
MLLSHLNIIKWELAYVLETSLEPLFWLGMINLLLCVRFILEKLLAYSLLLLGVHELNLGPVNFELDSNKVVDRFHASTHDATEFDDIITHCKSLFSQFYNNSRVEFVKRQANEVAHSLAKAATYLTNPQIFVDIPHCIEHILINEMLYIYIFTFTSKNKLPYFFFHNGAYD